MSVQCISQARMPSLGCLLNCISTCQVSSFRICGLNKKRRKKKQLSKSVSVKSGPFLSHSLPLNKKYSLIATTPIAVADCLSVPHALVALANVP